MVKAMIKRGHEVTVICEFPNYPSGKLRDEDKGRLFRVEYDGSCKIIRTFVWTAAEKNNLLRMLFYLSFAFSSLLAGLFTKRHDLVFASSPPIFHTASAMIVAVVKRSKFVLDIRDLWPDTVIQVEAISAGLFMKIAARLEKLLYRKAEVIFATNKGIEKRVTDRGGAGKVHIAYNGSIKSILDYKGDIEQFRRDHSWADKIVVLYAGIIGLGQNLTNLVPLFKRYENEIIFEIIGDGPQKAQLKEEVARLSLSNVKISDTMPMSKIIPYLCSADILLVVLRETKLFEITIPSKFFDCMAAGRPVIINVNGETRAIMEEYQTGKFFSASDPDTFSTALEFMINSPEERRRMGENGKKLVAARFLRSVISNEAVEIMER